ncbi:MAG: zf-TFIIB domain-containing protein [Myxococcales bacterium]|nr:zf-TFIIB domain-containing protein [Myxococcales bacterium]
MTPVVVDEALDDLEALRCPRCSGHWLERDDLKRLEQVVEVHWVEVRHIPPPREQDVPLLCPRCAPARHLVKLQSERDRKVVMDGCLHCQGVWLDGGELTAIRNKSVWAALVDAVRFLVRG